MTDVKTTDTEKYEALSAWAESDAPTIQPDAVIHDGSPEEHAAMRAMFMDMTGASDEDEMMRRMLGGRPTLDATAPGGESPMWKVRAGATLDADARAQAQREGRTLSDIVRDGVRLYLNTHAAA